MTDAGYAFDFDKKKLKKIEQNSAWSEEDEKKFRDVIRLVEQGAPVQSIRDHYTSWLKSLKERYTWNPSDEQMEALGAMAEYCDIATSFDAYKQGVVESLFKDLKKLKG